MTAHRTGPRDEWLAARLELLEAREGADTAQRRTGAAAAGTALGPDEQGVPLRDRRGRSVHSPISVAGRSQLLIYHFMFGSDYTAGCPSARRSRTASAAPPSTSRITTSRSARCRGLRSRSCRPTSGGWAGPFPGHLRPAATSTTTSRRRSSRSSGSREPPGTTSARLTSGRRRDGEGFSDEFASGIAGTDWATYRREGPA